MSLFIGFEMYLLNVKTFLYFILTFLKVQIYEYNITPY